MTVIRTGIILATVLRIILVGSPPRLYTILVLQVIGCLMAEKTAYGPELSVHLVLLIQMLIATLTEVLIWVPQVEVQGSLPIVWTFVGTLMQAIATTTPARWSLSVLLVIIGRLLLNQVIAAMRTTSALTMAISTLLKASAVLSEAQSAALESKLMN